MNCKIHNHKNFSRVFIRSIAALAGAAFLFATGCNSKKSVEDQTALQLVTTSKIKGLDPVMAGDLYSGRQVANAYEALYQYHYLKRPYTLDPLLAEELPTISPNGKTYTIKIKKGVLFQDDPSFEKNNGKGRELTAQDFVYSFMRLADPKETTDGWWIFDGKVVGLNEWREANKSSEKVDYDAKIEGLKAIDRYTLQINLTQPSQQFVYYLAMAFTSAVSREAVEFYDKDFLRNPVGTGPWKLNRDESNLNAKLVWDKNPTYRKELYPAEGDSADKDKGLLEDAGKPLPLADKMVVNVIVESQPMWLKFMSGSLDQAGIPKDNFQAAITPDKELSPDLKSKGIILHKAPQLDVTYTAFNMEDPIVGKNENLRKAIVAAYDVRPMIDLFYNGRAIPANSAVPPGVFGYEADYINSNQGYNLEKAKELLAKAGYPGGKGLPTLVMLNRSDSTSRQMGEYFIKKMEEIGVKVTINSFTWPDFVKNMNNKNGQIWGLAWGADYPDAENFLQLFYGKNKSPGPNNANYSNPDYDKLYEKLLTLKDGPQKMEIIRKMRGIIEKDTPWIFGVHRVGYSLNQPWLRNFKYIEFDHNQEKYLRVDAGIKKKYGKI